MTEPIEIVYDVIDEIILYPPTSTQNLGAAYLSTALNNAGVAQQFMGTGDIINKGRVIISRQNNNQTGQMQMLILDQNKTVVGSSVNIAMQSINNVAGWIEFDFANPVQTVSGSIYFVAIVNATAPGSGNMFITTGTSPDASRNGQMFLQYSAAWNSAIVISEVLPFQLLTLHTDPPTPIGNSYSSIADLQALLGFTFTDTTKPTLAQAQTMIEEADAFIDGWCGHDFRLHDTVETYDRLLEMPPGQILLNNFPLVQVNNVTFWQSNQWWPTIEGRTADGGPTDANYEVYPARCEIQFYRNFVNGMKVFQVDYTFGYATVPTNVAHLSSMLAALKVLAAWSGGVLQSYSLGDLRVQYPKDGKYGVQWANYTTQANQILRQLGLLRVTSGHDFSGRIGGQKV